MRNILNLFNHGAKIEHIINISTILPLHMSSLNHQISRIQSKIIFIRQETFL